MLKAFTSDWHQLPAYSIAEQLNQELSARHAAVVAAPPGAGKSTVLPLTLHQAMPHAHIVMLEPRRLAARQVAARMAQMLGERVGQTVGYQIRFERKVSDATHIEVVTEGILTRRMIDDPTLDGVDCLIFDEFHERSLQSDLAFCMARRVRELLRPELNIVVMSATIDTGELCRALNAHEVSCKGRLFPVEVEQAKDDCPPERIAVEVAAAICRAHREHEGDILAFLPGQSDILHCAELLGDSIAPTRVCTLYGNLSADKQYEAIAPSEPGQRKVVLATPIAETSLTIEGVRVVIDSGYYRKLIYDTTNGLSQLKTVRISHDMATQRTGRAGRMAPGYCYRMWTLGTDHHLDGHRQPEIIDADLMPLSLNVSAFGENDIMALPWLTPPPEGNLQRAIRQLKMLGALDEKGGITSMGQQMVVLPCHPRIARMMIQADGNENKAIACDLAAILEEKDIMVGLEAHTNLNDRVTRLREARRNRRLGAWGRVAKIAEEYMRMMSVKTDNSIVSSEDLGALLAAAYPERIAQVIGQGCSYMLAGGGTVTLETNDTLAGYPWLVVVSLHAGRQGAGRAFLAAPVTQQDVEKIAQWHNRIAWMGHQGGVVAQRELRIGQIVIQTKPLANKDNERIIDIVCEVVAKEGQSLLNWTDEVKTLQQRVALVAKWHSELSLPNLSTKHLLETVREWLPFYLEQADHVVSTAAELYKLPLKDILWNLLNYEQQQAVDHLAPMRIQVPSGSMIRVSYRIGAEVPVLSVRLQECFGLSQTPCIDNGRVPVLMELLSPGFKPVQLTSDLHSFWQTTYFEVRKELRRRYPKHYWPENPIEAQATHGVRRKENRK